MTRMLLSFAGLTLSTICLHAQPVSSPGKGNQNQDWPVYGNDAGGSRYSSLKQVNTANIKQLKLAWTYQSGELKFFEGNPVYKIAAFEATPIKIDNSLYFSTPSCRVIALDAATGKEIWVFDPKVNLHNAYSEITSRGVSSWPVSGDPASKLASRRIFVATIDGRLIALDAHTGTLLTSFGNKGTVDLRQGLGNDVSVTSPPAIIGNLIVVGSSLGDNQRFDYTRGAVRAYDVLTGTLQWTWDPIPKDSTDKAWNTWNGPKAHQSGAANAWSIISADAERDLVFIPTSSPSPDYYGGERLGQNLYGNSIVALRASTGKLVWLFQVVHHDLWDYDIAAQPMLIEVSRNGKKIPAVAVGTKMGHIFILNRETGESLFPVEERPVPISDVPGEQTWKTQPFPVLPAPLGLQGVSKKEAWGPTERDREDAEKKIAQYRNEGIFTPASYQGTMVAPSNVGGVNWGGMCFDPQKEMLITNINRIVAVIRMIPREKLAQLQKEQPDLLRAETGMQEGTPYVMKRDYLFRIAGGRILPQTAPPWGTLLAIDLHDGAKKWEVPLGYMLDLKTFPDAEKWGSINLGGAIVTAGNLIFVAASMDNHFRAFNSMTGELLWEFELPAGGQATPMTYEINNKQYIVIAAGGHGKLGTKKGDFVLAFGLP